MMETCIYYTMIVLVYNMYKYHKHGKLCVNLYTVITFKNIGISVSVIDKKFKISAYRYRQVWQKYWLSANLKYRLSVIFPYRSIPDFVCVCVGGGAKWQQ